MKTSAYHLVVRLIFALIGTVVLSWVYEGNLQSENLLQFFSLALLGQLFIFLIIRMRGKWIAYFNSLNRDEFV